MKPSSPRYTVRAAAHFGLESPPGTARPVLRLYEQAQLGFTFGVVPGGVDLTAPCVTGGCWSCAALVNGRIVRACVHPVADGMVVQTALPPDQPPLRIVHGPQPHSVGGKATPWNLKSRWRYIEVAIWAAGCNLRCPQCQNYATTYDGRSPPFTPEQAAYRITHARQRYRVDRRNEAPVADGGQVTSPKKWAEAGLSLHLAGPTAGVRDRRRGRARQVPAGLCVHWELMN